MTPHPDVTVLVNRFERLKRSSDSRPEGDERESLRNKANDTAAQLCGLLRRLGISGPRPQV